MKDTDGPGALYAASYQRLVGVVSLVADSRADAQDAVSEAFARLIPRWSTVGNYDDPEAWVRLVAFRLLSNKFRRARRLVHGSDDEPPPQPPATGDRVDVTRALAALNIGQRQVVVLHHLLDRPVAQIAEELGISVGTVKSRLSRARAALAPLFAEENESV